MHKLKKTLGTYIYLFLILCYKNTRGLTGKILRAGLELVWTGLVWFENSPNNLKFFLFQLDTTDMFYIVTCGPFPTRVQMAKERKNILKNHHALLLHVRFTILTSKMPTVSAHIPRRRLIKKLDFLVKILLNKMLKTDRFY